MNFIKFWKSFLGPISFSFGGGGGGGPTQTTSTSQTSNIPDYAQPYVENMLESTQRQIYTTDPNTGERTGFTPYRPYSQNASDYVAPFQPMQVQAQEGIKNLQVPGAIGAGAMGSFFAGQNYANQMQDPASMASYMNPYQQGVTDVAKNAAVREAQMAQNASNLGAARQGTYGGARQTLANSERERNLMSNLSNIQAQGSNQAYQQAIANQQFGAGLGMQGYGQAAQLAGQGLKAQQDLYGLQNQYGGQQQAQEQQKIAQSIQDYANQQQYPLMQLGTMSNMLRGLPMQSANTNQYVAAPNALTQGIGLAGAGASIYNALKKEGGVIKEMASGGITSIPRYYEGDVVESTKSDLYDLPLEELDRRAKSSTSPTIKRLAATIAKEKRMGLAGGGIIAFANPNEENNQGVVKEEFDPSPTSYAPGTPFINPNVAVNKLTNEQMETVRNRGSIPLTTRQQAAKQASTQEGPKTLPKDFPSELSYAENKAQTDFQQKAIEQGARPKSREYPNPQLTNEERVAGFKAALEGKSTTAPAPAPVSETRTKDQIIADANKQNVKVQADPNISKEDKAALQKRHNDGIALVKADPNIGIKAAAPSTGVGIKPNTGIVPNIGGIKGPTNLPAGLEAPVDPDANKTIAQLAAEKEAYMGANAGAQEARKNLMAEKANSADEARRITALRFAEFFGAWGSTPGNTIVAGLNTLKNKIPDFVTDIKEASKIRKGIDKDIAELDKIDRLEKSGNYDEAVKRKKELTKNSIDTWGVKYKAAVDLQVANIGAESRIEAAKVGAAYKGDVNSGKDRRFYEKEISELDKNHNNLTAGKDTPYVRDQNFINRNKEKAAKGELTPTVKGMYDEAVKRNASINEEYKTRKAELTAELNRFSGNKSDTPAVVAPATVLPAGAEPGSKLVGTAKGTGEQVYERPDGSRYTIK
jgi:soluble cytochrome b562